MRVGDAGLIHLYTGEGKGKTTAAVGLTARMSGCGKSVVFAQFLKGEDSGERRALQLLPGVTLMPVPARVPFLFTMTAGEKADFARLTERQFADACVRAADKDMLVLDEALCAVEAGVLPAGAVVDFLRDKPRALEVVLTGRAAPEEIMALAHYISRADSVRHPFDAGVPARRGIEF